VKKTLIFSFLTITLIALIIWGGIPLLVQIFNFLGQIKSSKEPVRQETITLLPVPPKLQPLPKATNQPTINLAGFAQPGMKVKIFLNDKLTKEVITAADGSFTAEKIPLSLGKNKIKARVIDNSGNESKDSNLLIVDFDQTPPELKIEKPEEKRETKIIGQTEPEAILKINNHLVVVDPEGNFSYPIILSEGENEILIEAEDEAGNKTSQTLILTVNE